MISFNNCSTLLLTMLLITSCRGVQGYPGERLPEKQIVNLSLCPRPLNPNESFLTHGQVGDYSFTKSIELLPAVHLIEVQANIIDTPYNCSDVMDFDEGEFSHCISVYGNSSWQCPREKFEKQARSCLQPFISKKCFIRANLELGGKYSICTSKEPVGAKVFLKANNEDIAREFSCEANGGFVNSRTILK